MEGQSAAGFNERPVVPGSVGLSVAAGLNLSVSQSLCVLTEGQWLPFFIRGAVAAGFDGELVDPGFNELQVAAGFIGGPVAAGLDGEPVNPAASRLSAHIGLLAPFAVPLPLPSLKPPVSQCFHCPLLFNL